MRWAEFQGSQQMASNDPDLGASESAAAEAVHGGACCGVRGRYPRDRCWVCGMRLPSTSSQIQNLRKGHERNLLINVYVPLFIMANLQSQPRCPVAEEWIKKMHI